MDRVLMTIVCWQTDLQESWVTCCFLIDSILCQDSFLSIIVFIPIILGLLSILCGIHSWHITLQQPCLSSTSSIILTEGLILQDFLTLTSHTFLQGWCLQLFQAWQVFLEWRLYLHLLRVPRLFLPLSLPIPFWQTNMMLILRLLRLRMQFSPIRRHLPWQPLPRVNLRLLHL